VNNRFTSDLFLRLPRELRNHVYTFCVRGLYDDEVIVRRSTDAISSTSLLIREHAGQYSYRWIEDPIRAILNVPVLGVDVAREMLEAYYWTRTFKISHRELPLLGSFLKTDRHGLNMIPSIYIRRLQVQLQVGNYVRTHLLEDKGSKEEGALRAIEALGRDLTTRTEIAIDVILDGDLSDHYDGSRIACRHAEHILEILRIVGGLRERGFRIIISHNELWGLSGDCASDTETLYSYLAERGSLEVGTVTT
jgi:hypothetical protein